MFHVWHHLFTHKLRSVCHCLIINRKEGRRWNCKEIMTFSTELFHAKRETVSCWNTDAMLFI